MSLQVERTRHLLRTLGLGQDLLEVLPPRAADQGTGAAMRGQCPADGKADPRRRMPNPDRRAVVGRLQVRKFAGTPVPRALVPPKDRPARSVFRKAVMYRTGQHPGKASKRGPMRLRRCRKPTWRSCPHSPIGRPQVSCGRERCAIRGSDTELHHRSGFEPVTSAKTITGLRTSHLQFYCAQESLARVKIFYENKFLDLCASSHDQRIVAVVRNVCRCPCIPAGQRRTSSILPLDSEGCVLLHCDPSICCKHAHA